jgi:hypothetical protein
MLTVASSQQIALDSMKEKLSNLWPAIIKAVLGIACLPECKCCL